MRRDYTTQRGNEQDMSSRRQRVHDGLAQLLRLAEPVLGRGRRRLFRVARLLLRGLEVLRLGRVLLDLLLRLGLDLGRVGPRLRLLELWARGKLGLDRRQQRVDGADRRLLEVARVHLARGVRLLELVDRAEVGDAAAELGVALDGQDGVARRTTRRVDPRARVGAALALEELANGDDDVPQEGENAVALDLARGAVRLLDLGLDRGGAVEEVNLRVGVRRRHLAAREAGHHEVHEVGALLVANLGEVLLGVSENLALVDATKLEVDAEVLLVERLEERVQEAGQEGRRDLLDDLCAGLARIVLGRDRRQLVLVEVVLGVVLVRRADDKLELVEREVERAEDGGDDAAVVVDARLDELNRRLEVVKEGVDVWSRAGERQWVSESAGEQVSLRGLTGEEDLDLDAGRQEVGNLGERDKVTQVRATRRGRSPVSREVALLEQGAELLAAERLCQVLRDERVLLLGRAARNRVCLLYTSPSPRDS